MRPTPTEQRSVAYISTEMGIDENIRTCSVGIGILAGDTIRSAADLHVPMVAVILLYRKSAGMARTCRKSGIGNGRSYVLLRDDCVASATFSV